MLFIVLKSFVFTIFAVSITISFIFQLAEKSPKCYQFFITMRVKVLFYTAQE